MNVIAGILKESYFLFNRMAPYLLFGFLFAGVLHMFVKPGMIAKHLGKSNFSSVIKAALFGIPLPLCSCSVIPTAMALRKEGATRGSVLSFLISTPTTGVDSIFATYSLLGGIFTFYRILASFITGTLAGILSNIFIKEDKIELKTKNSECKLCHVEEEHAHGIFDRIKGVFGYAFGDLIRDTGNSLLVGVLIGGIITFFMPERFIETYLGSGIKAMFAMLLVGIPMYVCASASIPIAAALMIKGLSPGAALVFLITGPATNIVTMTVVAKNMGKKTLLIYLSSIVSCSLILGITLDKLYGCFSRIDPVQFMRHYHGVMLFDSIGMYAGVILLALIMFNFIKKGSNRFSRKSLLTVFVILVVLSFNQVSFSQAAQGASSTSAKKFTSRQIYKLIASYIASQTRNTGTFSVYDPLVKRTRRLQFMKLKPGVFKTRSGYYSRVSCRDNDNGEWVDVDFNIKLSEEGKLDVDEITLFSVGGVRRYSRDKNGEIISFKK